MISARPYQVEALNAVAAAAGRGVTRQLITLPTGSGKAQPVDEPVLTPTGWRTMGGLAVGDRVVNEYGKPTEVVGVFPQGDRPVARVRFSDGTETRCDWDHLWSVLTRSDRAENRYMRRGRTVPIQPRVLTLRQIADEGLRDKRGGLLHYVSLVEPIAYDPVSLPLDPYLLGALLGDGGLTIPGLVKLHTQDDVAALVALPPGIHLAWLSSGGGGMSNYLIGGRVGRSPNAVMDALRALGLHGLYSYEKFIPPTYMLGAPEDRLALLRGLLDTDGSVSGRSSVEYATSSEQLAKDVRALVLSLGGTCSVRSRIPHYTYKGQRLAGRTSYRLTVLLPNGTNPFRVPRKADKWQPRTTYQPVRAIEAIEEDGTAECVCIQVASHGQLYITNDYVVTHNTVVFSHLIDKAHREGKRSLVLAHRDELLQQAADKLLMVQPGLEWEIGFVRNVQNETDKAVTIASVQTISRPNRLAQLGGYGLVITDEAHHSASESYVRVLEGLGCMAEGGPLTIGVTATPQRADSKDLGDIWQEIVYSKDLLWMIREQYLCNLRGIRVRLADFDTSKLKISHGDFTDASASDALEEANAPEHAVAAYQEHVPGRRALVFTPTVSLSQQMAAAFVDAGITAEHVDGETPMDERRAILARFHSGETAVLSNCAVLTEGYDEPLIDAIIVARPTKSKPLYAQMVGRGTRIAPGKADCVVLDLVGATDRFDLITLPLMFGLSTAKAQAKLESEGALEAAEEEEYILTGQAKRESYEVDLFGRKDRLAWTPVGPGSWTLPVDGGQLVVEAWRDSFSVVRYWNDRSPADVLAVGLDLGYAMGIAEDVARKSAPALADPKAPWRGKPATDRQLATLRNMRIEHGSGISAGEASSLISARIARKMVGAR